MRTSVKLCAAGDAIIQRRIHDDFEGYGELAPFIMQADARFFNLETTINREGECPASQFSGGTYLRAAPEVLSDIRRFGFNITSFNNNHSLDFMHNGLQKTLEYLDKSEFIHAGVGNDLDMASAPRYLETRNGRVALISVSTSFEPSMMAGNKSARYSGRAGVNGIRLCEKLTVGREEFELIKGLAAKLNVNIENEISRREGYLSELPDGVAEFGELRFLLGTSCERRLIPNEADMKRVEKSIYEARFAADYIMLSMHSHEVDGERKEDVPEFLSELAHRFVDMGADAVVGHGPHLLRPIEIYRDRPIFYSLGDFILELYSVESAPADFFLRHGLSSEDTVHDLLKKRSRDFTVGLMEDRRMNETVIPYWESVEGRLTRLSLMPVELVMQGNKSERGLPRRAAKRETVARICDRLSGRGVRFEVSDDGLINCKW